MNTTNSIGERIRLARISALGSRKMSQSELARKLGCNVDSVRNWERGRVTPDNERLKQIAAICHTDWRWLLIGDVVNGFEDEKFKDIVIDSMRILHNFNPDEEEKKFQSALFRILGCWGINLNIDEIEDKDEFFLFLKKIIIQGADLYKYMKHLQKEEN